MRKLFIGILLASVAVTPALAASGSGPDRKSNAIETSPGRTLAVRPLQRNRNPTAAKEARPASPRLCRPPMQERPGPANVEPHRKLLALKSRFTLKR